MDHEAERVGTRVDRTSLERPRLGQDDLVAEIEKARVTRSETSRDVARLGGVQERMRRSVADKRALLTRRIAQATGQGRALKRSMPPAGTRAEEPVRPPVDPRDHDFVAQSRMQRGDWKTLSPAGSELTSLIERVAGPDARPVVRELVTFLAEHDPDEAALRRAYGAVVTLLARAQHALDPAALRRQIAKKGPDPSVAQVGVYATTSRNGSPALVVRLRFPYHPDQASFGDWRYLCRTCWSDHAGDHPHVRPAHRFAESTERERAYEQERALAFSGGLYNDAVEAQLATISFLRRNDPIQSPTGDRHGWMNLVGFDPNDPSAARRARAFSDALADELGLAEPFFWTREICDLVHPSAAAMPPWTLRREGLPAPAGFFHLARPFLLPDYPDTRHPNQVVGVSWSPVVGTDEPAFFVVFYRPQGVGLASTPLCAIHWWVGRTYASCRERGDTSTMLPAQLERLESCARLFAASCSFLEQKILVTSSGRVRRETRKRAASEKIESSPLVRVVHLRRVERAGGAPSGTGEPVEWSCRWLVSGHWRQQWHPSTESHAPTWIAPYSKGPEGKPFRAPRATVFAVDR